MCVCVCVCVYRGGGYSINTPQAEVSPDRPCPSPLNVLLQPLIQWSCWSLRLLGAQRPSGSLWTSTTTNRHTTLTRLPPLPDQTAQTYKKKERKKHMLIIYKWGPSFRKLCLNSSKVQLLFEPLMLNILHLWFVWAKLEGRSFLNALWDLKRFWWLHVIYV